ncbi:MAG TPA: hypothetical protein VH231_06890 [Solirubrobacteraceae bacterium]|jgi:hypothetical protein|nr:hypothetical protein [Solirubrobacteraceae bacterium]
MRRIVLVAVLAAGTVGGTAVPAAADFPEQPNGHVANGCNAIVNRSAATTAPRSATAINIVVPLLNDACFGA